MRRARASDVRAVRALTEPLVQRGVLVAKHAVASYESVPEFRVAELDGDVVGCGALHVMWEDLAEVRTLAVDLRARGLGVGSAIAGGPAGRRPRERRLAGVLPDLRGATSSPGTASR